MLRLGSRTSGRVLAWWGCWQWFTDNSIAISGLLLCCNCEILIYTVLLKGTLLLRSDRVDMARPTRALFNGGGKDAKDWFCLLSQSFLWKRGCRSKILLSVGNKHHKGEGVSLGVLSHTSQLKNKSYDYCIQRNDYIEASHKALFTLLD